MKTLAKIIAIWLLGANITVAAQQIPEFKTSFYFTDRLGNRDSVEVGFDRRAYNSADSVDVVFGETDISTKPFNKVLDVRVGYPGSVHTKIGIFMMKKCDSSRRVIPGIMLRAQNFPVTMNWDRSAFNDPCLASSQFTRCESIFIYDFNEPTKRFLKDSNQLVIDRKYMNGWQNRFTQIYTAMDDQTKDTVQLFNIVLSYKRGKTGASADQQLKDKIVIGPNPGSSFFTVKIEEEAELPAEWELALTDLTGRTHWKNTFSGQQRIVNNDVSDLPSGVFILQIRTKNQLLYADKWIHL